jgi:hypothetical protein
MGCPSGAPAPAFVPLDYGERIQFLLSIFSLMASLTVSNEMGDISRAAGTMGHQHIHDGSGGH